VSLTPDPGSAVRLEFTKWGALPHWEMDAVLLGTDEHGDWLGFPVGTPMSRPGLALVSPNPQVGLLPAGGAFGTGWVATFHGPGHKNEVTTYVDITTPASWDGTVARAVDLDLDVVELRDGTVFLDDEDEFEEHAVSLAYPDDVVDLARASSELVLTAVRRHLPPFDGAHATWLERLASLPAS
jgi:uncharacterized protein